MSSSLDNQPWPSHRIERHELRAGDHIYSWRRLKIYSHHGIYVGGGKVIHYTGKVSGSIARIGSVLGSSPPASRRHCAKCGEKVRGRGVISSCLDCFVKKGKLYRYKYGVTREGLAAAFKVRGLCSTAASDPAEDVIYRDNYLLDNNGFGRYDLAGNNCEDFSLYCKTEKMVPPDSREPRGCSSQMKSIGAFFSAVYRFNIGGAYRKFRYKSDIGVRQDVRRVSLQELSDYYHQLSGY